MKHKFNAGDKVVYIFEPDHSAAWEISNEIIETVSLYEDRVEYHLVGLCESILEKDLYNKEEAIEFLKGVLDD